MATSTLTSKGQVTIPKEVRERLGVTEGDRLVFRFDDEGRLMVEPQRNDPLAGFSGLLRHLAKSRPVTLEEMKEGVRKHVTGKFRKPLA